jgi:pyridoxamine 5'-phosphate oxidase
MENSSDESLRQSRREFTSGVLLEADIPGDPLDLLLGWYKAAVDRSVPDANAMSLSTIDLDGFPVSRIVLLRDASKEGLSFFTNYQSRKGLEIAANPKAEAQFFWQTLERQARIRGRIAKVSEAESDAYFASRPRESQIGAWASRQSAVIASRDVLERAVEDYKEKFKSLEAVPRPPHWGGYRLVPDTYEFWQGRPSRLHDRFRATLKNGAWIWERLSP